MSTDQISWEHDARGLKFAIVVSRFNREITDKLLAGAKQALERAGAEGFEVFYVPGAFELPLAAKMLAHTHAFHAVIALGAVIRGETPHFEHVCREAASGIREVGLATGVPVTFGLITALTEAQAWDRAGGKVGNRGEEAALAAIEMVEVLARARGGRAQGHGGRRG